jgi:branched-chain amino acid transport system permease protein
MTRGVEILLSGVSLGLLYALIALGFVIVFKATRTVNFAHASFLLFGVWVVAQTSPHIGFAAAVALGLVAAGTLGLAVERLLLSRVDGRKHDALAILTIGVNVVLTAELSWRIGESVLPLGAPWDGHVVHFGSVVLPLSVIITIVTVPLLIAGLAAVLRHTGWGLAMRASIEDREGAALAGVRLKRVSAGAWIAAGILAVAAGIGLASFPSPGVAVSTGTVAIKAFPAAIIGGLDSLGGAIVGGLVIGIAEVTVAEYQDALSFLGRGLGDVVAYVIMICILLCRPSGLFGAKEVSRA